MLAIKLISIFILLFILELVYFKTADHFNIIDKPNQRSSHTRIVLRGGGIIFMLAVWIWIATFGLQYPWFLLGLTLIADISFIDDIHSLPDSLRLIVQFLAMFLLFYEWDVLHLNMWWIIILALILCVGIINAFNFMDGINGMIGGYSLTVISTLLFINTQTQYEFTNPTLLLVVIFSLIVFCIFNFRTNAKCFAGDVGSIGIAFIILFILGQCILFTKDFTYIILLAVYGVDTVLTICHRILLHENIGQAHRKHLYQIMANELHMKHPLVSTIYLATQTIINIGFLLLPSEQLCHWIYLGAILVILCLTYLLFMKKYYHLHEEYLKSKQA